MHIEVEKPKINPAHFIAIIGAALVNAFIIGGVWVSFNRDIADIRTLRNGHRRFSTTPSGRFRRYLRFHSR